LSVTAGSCCCQVRSRMYYRFFCASHPAVTPRRQPRGLPGDAIPNEVRRDAVPSEARECPAIARQDRLRSVVPSAPLYVAPSASEGSLGANAPRDDTDGRLSPRTLSSSRAMREASSFARLRHEQTNECLVIVSRVRTRLN